MRSYPLTIFLFLLASVPANSQEQTPGAAEGQTPGVSIQGMEVGRGVICDTAEQAQRFANLRIEGKDTLVALRLVNGQVQAHRSCNVALVLFNESKPVSALTLQNRAITVMSINVHAFNNGTSWTAVSPTVQYTVVAEKGIVI
jgi:hypothetical protein